MYWYFAIGNKQITATKNHDTDLIVIRVTMNLKTRLKTQPNTTEVPEGKLCCFLIIWSSEKIEFGIKNELLP